MGLCMILRRGRLVLLKLEDGVPALDIRSR